MAERSFEEFKCLAKAGQVAEAILANPTKPVRDIAFKILAGRIPRMTDEERLAMLTSEEREAFDMLYGVIGKEYAGLFADFQPRTKTKPTYSPTLEPWQPHLPEPGKMIDRAVTESKEAQKASKAAMKDAKEAVNCILNLTKNKRNDKYIVNVACTLCLCGDVITEKSVLKKPEVGIQYSQVRDIIPVLEK